MAICLGVESECDRCGKEVTSLEKFCPHCGSKNPDFSKQTLELAAETTLGELLGLCRAGHVDMKECLTEDPDYYCDRFFCTICGKNLSSL